MAPANELAIGTIVLKAVTGSAGAAIQSHLRQPWARWWTSLVVTKRSRKRGWPLTTRGVYRWISGTEFAEMIRTGAPRDAIMAKKRLAFLLPSELRDDGVLDAIMNDVVHQLIIGASPSRATAMATSVTNEKLTTLKQSIETGNAEIVAAIGAPSELENDLMRVNPLRRQLIEAAVSGWTPFAGLLRDLVSSDDRTGLIRQWSIHTPTGLNATGSAPWLALALLSLDYSETDSFHYYFKQALDRGAAPRDYWLARASLAMTGSARLEYLRMGGNNHPLGLALEAALGGDYTAAELHFESWRPVANDDVALGVAVLAYIKVGGGDLNAAIGILQAYRGSSADIPLYASKLLLSRAQYGSSALPVVDALQAMTIALKARDMYRVWNGRSAEAAVVAMQAALFASNHDRAWSIVRGAPVGEATPNEVADRGLRVEALIEAARRGDLPAAQEIIDGHPDGFELAILQSVRAAVDGHKKNQQKNLNEAFKLAPSEAQRISVGYLLVLSGAELPTFPTVSPEFAIAVRDLQMLSEANVDTAGDLTLLRAKASESRSLTFMLAERLETLGELHQAADALIAGANRWSDPLLMSIAARLLLRADDSAAAVRAAEGALNLSGSGWTGEFDTRAVLLDAYEAEERFDESSRQARTLVSLAPENRDARWALIISEMRAGDESGAWSTLTHTGLPIDPRTASDAGAWIVLMTKFDRSPNLIKRALGVLKRWPNDEHLAAAFFTSLLIGGDGASSEPTEDELDELYKSLEEFNQQFPNSRLLRSISADIESPLDALADEIRSSTARAQRIRKAISKGRVPVGAAAGPVGKPYAQLLVQRAGGLVRAHPSHIDPTWTIPDYAGQEVVLDPSAAATLALLGVDLVVSLRGQFSSVTTTDAAYRDAKNGQSASSVASGLSVSWDVVQNRPVVEALPQSQFDSVKAHATKLVESLESCRRLTWTGPKSLPEDLGSDPWLSTLDVALSSNFLFWCDDIAYRSLAESLGCVVIGTIDLLRDLERRSIVSQEIREAAEAILIKHYYVDLGSDARSIILACSEDGFAPRGGAASLAQVSTWQNPYEALSLLFEILDQLPSDRPDWLRDWIGAAATGLVSASGSAKAASENLRILIFQLAPRSWFTSDTAPWVIFGIRQALSDRPDLDDPVGPAIASMLDALAEVHGIQLASQLLVDLFAQSDPQVKELVRNSILLSQRRA
ncbi:hypothetical protein [Tersicoccus sp. Bi-70]|uniref:PIN domain-containing protein n=1 Tax=Tersicoccus sp. Bi-70 TaxID=1897634 RepID=UPI0011804F06|nr:hypothetical protein [Tersicoccus sp. Bi-70]